MSRQGQDLNRATNNQHGQKHGRVGGPIRSGNRARQGGSGATDAPTQPARTDREPAPAPVHTVGSWANIVKNGPSNEGANAATQPDNNQAEPGNQPPSELFRSGELAFGNFEDEMNAEAAASSEKPHPAPPAQPAPPPAAATAAAPPPPPARPAPAASPKRTGANPSAGQIVGNPHLNPAGTAAGGSHPMPPPQHQQQGNAAGQLPHHPPHAGGQHMHHANHGSNPHGGSHRKGGGVWAPRGGAQAPSDGPHGAHAAAGQVHTEPQGHRGAGSGSRGAGGYAAVGGAAGQGHATAGAKVAAAGAMGPAGLAAAAGSGAYSQQQYAAMQQGQMPVPMGMMYSMPAYGYMYPAGTYATAPVMGYQYMAGYPQGQYPAAGYVQQSGAAMPGQPGGQQQQMPPQQQQQQHAAQHQPHMPQQQQPAPPQQQPGHQQQYAHAGGAPHPRHQPHATQQPGHSSTAAGPSSGQQQGPHSQGSAGAHATSHSTPAAPASVASPHHAPAAPHIGAKGGHAAAAAAAGHGGASPSMVKPPAKKIITIVDPKTQQQVKVDTKASSSGKASPAPAAPAAAVPAAPPAPVVAAAAAVPAAGSAALPITPPRLATPPGKAGSAAIPIVPPQPRQPKPPAAAKPAVEEAAKPPQPVAETAKAEPAAQAAAAPEPAAESAAETQEPAKETAAPVAAEEPQAVVEEAAKPADEAGPVPAAAAAAVVESKNSDAASVDTSAPEASKDEPAIDAAQVENVDAGADPSVGEVKEQKPAETAAAAAPAESKEPETTAAAVKAESLAADTTAAEQKTEAAVEAAPDGNASVSAQPEQPAAAEQPSPAATAAAADDSKPPSAADLKKQPSWSEMAKSAASKPVSKPVPVSRTASTDAVAPPPAPAAAAVKPSVLASNGPSKADTKPAAAAAATKDAAPAANPAPPKGKKGKKGYEDKLSSDMYDTFRPVQPAAAAAAEAAPAAEPAVAEQSKKEVPDQPAEQEPERTESNADESWEDKAEKDEPAAPKTADAAEAITTPFSSDRTEDDGRKRYTLDFLKKHREAHKERPESLTDGEWVGNPAEAAAGGFGAGGFDRMGARRGSRNQGMDRMDSDWGAGGNRRRDGPPGGMRGEGGFRDGRDARGVADRAMRGVMDGGRQGNARAGADGDLWARGRPLPPARSGNMGGGMRGGAVPNLPALHKTESAFKVGVTRTDDPEEEAKQKAFKGILNKLTPDNFERLSQQLLDVGITEAKTLIGLIAQVFDKALFEPHFCELYSELCYVLQKKLPEFDDPDSPQEEGKPKRKLNFRRLLLNKCQEEFEKGDAAMNAVAEREAKRAQGEEEKDDDDGKDDKATEESDQPEQQLEEGEIPPSPETEKQKKEAAAAAKLEKRRAEAQAEQEELKARRRALGNIQYIGQLYRFGMLTENIMHSCIKRLLQDDQNPRAEDIECLCKLLSTVGQQLESPKVKGRAGMTHTQVQEMQREAEQGAKRMMDVYFERIKRLSQSDKLESRLRFMLMDVMEQRDRRWETRRKKEGPKRIEDVHREAQQEAASIARRDERGGRGGGLDRMNSGRMGGFGGGGDSRGGGAQGPGLLRREEMLGAPIRASLGHRTASEELSFRPQMGRSPMRGAGGAGGAAGGLAAAGGKPSSGLREEGRQPPPPSRGDRVSDSSADAGGRPPLPPTAASSAGSSAGGAGDMSLADIIAAGKNYDGAVKGKAAELAGVLLKVRQPEEEDLTVLEQLLSQSAAPAVGLVALLKEGLDVRGVDVEKRLAGLQPFLQAQLTATDVTLITKSDMSTALLALIGILPDLVEDVPKAPVLLAEVIGHFMAAGLLTFGLSEMAKAVKEAGAEDAAAGDEEDELDPPLIDSEKALPMLLIVANAIKAASDEAAAKSAWSAAAIDMASLLPSFSRDDAGEVDKVLSKYDAVYLK